MKKGILARIMLGTLALGAGAIAPQSCGAKPRVDFEARAIGGTQDNGMAPAAVVHGFAKAPTAEGK